MADGRQRKRGEGVGCVFFVRAIVPFCLILTPMAWQIKHTHAHRHTHAHARMHRNPKRTDCQRSTLFRENPKPRRNTHHVSARRSTRRGGGGLHTTVQMPSDPSSTHQSSNSCSTMRVVHPVVAQEVNIGQVVKERGGGNADPLFPDACMRRPCHHRTAHTACRSVARGVLKLVTKGGDLFTYHSHTSPPFDITSARSSIIWYCGLPSNWVCFCWYQPAGPL
jgi:hypothetical protein